ncbi:hypothetical protein HDU97_004766 [Phlyctochytrium planicorne]|nr:hypothetical protein HDU97_004766 [Phlyctochytrium planicorne]
MALVNTDSALPLIVTNILLDRVAFPYSEPLAWGKEFGVWEARHKKASDATRKSLENLRGDEPSSPSNPQECYSGHYDNIAYGQVQFDFNADLNATLTFVETGIQMPFLHWVNDTWLGWNFYQLHNDFPEILLKFESGGKGTGKGCLVKSFTVALEPPITFDKV